MPQNFDPSRAFICSLCEDEGMRFDAATTTATFCTCAIGQRRKRMHDAREEKTRLEGAARREKQERRLRNASRDYKADAAGNGERWPGEDDEPPF